MIEIELFCRIVEAEIRRMHSDYLKEIKRLPIEMELPEVEPLPTGDAWRALGFIGRWRAKRRYKRQLRLRKKAQRRMPVPVDDKLLKGFNQGVERSIAIMLHEWKAYEKRLAKVEGQEVFHP